MSLHHADLKDNNEIGMQIDAARGGYNNFISLQAANYLQQKKAKLCSLLPIQKFRMLFFWRRCKLYFEIQCESTYLHSRTEGQPQHQLIRMLSSKAKVLLFTLDSRASSVCCGYPFFKCFQIPFWKVNTRNYGMNPIIAIDQISVHSCH